MKKIVSILIALALCLSAAAFAESVPSKTTGDLVQFEVAADNLPADSGFFIQPIAENNEAYQQNVKICQNEITKLAQSENVAAYFGEVKNAAGEVVDMKELLGSDTLNVYEFCALIAGGYQESYGNVSVKMQFSTPYEKDEKVIILIGLVEADQGGMQSVNWTAYEGFGVEEQGCIQVELDPEIILAIQNGTALLAIVSK